jgi:hypothetical protein
MMLLGRKKELILLTQYKKSKWFRLVCFGRKRHYRQDGTCVHTDEVLARVKPKVRYRVKIDPFGGKGASINGT